MFSKMVWKPHFIPFKYFNEKGEATSKRNNKTKFFDVAADFLARLNKAKYHKEKLIHPRTRRVKSYGIYKLFLGNDTIVKLYKRVKLKVFKEYLGINKTNRIIGWTPDYVGASKSRKVKKRNYIYELIKHNLHMIKERCDVSFINDMYKSLIDHRVVYSPGYDTTFDHLKEYFKDNTSNISVDDIFNILDHQKYLWFNGAKVSFYNSDEVYSLVRVNNKAYSGHYTSKIFGNEKYKSDYESRNIAKKFNNIMKERPLKNMYLWSVLGRERDIKLSSKNTEVGTRVILSNENPASTLLMWYAQKIALYINNCADDHKSFNILGEFNGNKSSKLYDYEKEYDYKLEADWTKFDSNIDSNFLIAAGLIITYGLPRDKFHNNIRYYIIKSIVTKYVVLPPGVVVELNRANASGHPFTTLVNCIVNLIYWSIIGFKIYGKNYSRYMRVEVYGDDTLAFFKRHKNLNKIDEIIADIGLKSESIKDNFRICGLDCDRENEIDFLKRRIKPYGLEWNHKKMFDRLFYQTKNRHFDEQVELMDSYYQTCKLDDNVREFNRIIFSYIKGSRYYRDMIKDVDRLNILYKEDYMGDSSKVVIEDRFYSHHNPQSFRERYDKLMKIYNFSILKHKLERNYNIYHGITSSSSSFLLYLLGFSRDNALTESDNDVVFFGRSPPEDLIKEKNDMSKRYCEKNNKMNEDYLKRIVKKIG